ncbi:MAG: hypothetical protein J4F40_03840 [Alphaproteobacteria bacterium]|nr:hypothetical protein [Alphaproteobacteria bacterium]
MKKRHRNVLSASAVFSLLALTPMATASMATAARAESIVSHGVEFSDELGGLRLVSAAGSGTRDDPFIVVEEYTGPGSAVLVIRGLDRLFGSASGIMRPVGLVMRKIVKNGTRERWREFDLELREHFNHPSDYFDGLSFDQMKTMEHPAASDLFAHVRPVMEPFDYLRFSDGIVEPGETVSFEIVITDATPQPTIFLVQRAPTRISEVLPNHPRVHLMAETPGAQGTKVVLKSELR